MKFLELPALFLSVMIAGCGGGSSSSTATSPPPKTAAESTDPSCPVAVAGTSVSVEDTANGAAFVFVTTGDVADLRRRANTMASMHNDHHGSMGALPDGKDAGGGHAGHDMSGHAGHDMGGSGGHSSGGHAGHDMSGNKHAGHAGGMIGVHSKAMFSEVEGGAKITFVANGGDVAKLQSELRMHAQHFSAGTCGMSKP